MSLPAQSPKRLSLCKLDGTVELSALDNCFLLTVKNGAERPHRYYYSWIGEALRAYILYSLRQFSQRSPGEDISRLIEQVDKLDMNISSAAIQMSGNMQTIKKEIEARLNDPIEQEIARRGFLWNLGVPA